MRLIHPLLAVGSMKVHGLEAANSSLVLSLFHGLRFVIFFTLKPPGVLFGFLKIYKSRSDYLRPGLTVKEFIKQQKVDPIFWKGLLYPF
ncbi:MAG: hypothetical protein CM1200mP30_30060 [Pseudomonadota bacterium]|nr:MAG: hypothetical protein CM1200mP30_30060 [Pseudomonadota bacterium]